MATLQDATKFDDVIFGTNWVGLIAPFAKAGAAPSGWLLCNGAAVSRSTYSALFGVASTTWGGGDGNTTFNVPDMRGEFPRGFDAGRGVDSGRSFASAQGSAIGSRDYVCWETLAHYGSGQVSPNTWDLMQLKQPGYPNAYGGEPAIMYDYNWYHSACGIGYNTGRWCNSTGNNSGTGEMLPNNRAIQFMIKY